MKALKKQGVAWMITVVMILVAVGIGQGKAAYYQYVEQEPEVEITAVPNEDFAYTEASAYIRDEAGVLDSETVETLESRNAELLLEMDVVIAVATCNNGGDLFDWALNYAEDMNLGGYDFIVVMDIAAESALLVQGADLSSEGWFSDDDCADYVAKYLEEDFMEGDYDSGILSLFDALEEWYHDNY